MTLLASKEPDIQFNHEVEVFSNLIKLRNGNNPSMFDPKIGGFMYVSTSDARVNETNFSNVYETIFAINKLNVPDHKQTKYDDKLNEIISDLDSSPLWYELTKEVLTQSSTPDCRIASFPYYQHRNRTLLNSRLLVKNIPMFEGFNEHKNKTVVVDNDFYIQGVKEVGLHRLLQFRLNEELNSHYVTHPSEFMLVYSLALKSTCNEYFDYGLRFLELFMLKDKNEEYPYYHLPVEYRSDGTFVGAQYHSRFPLLLRIIINRLSLLIYYVDSHSFNDEHIDVLDEVLLFILSDPMNNGKSFKKAFTAINLYYGMDTKAPVSPKIGSIHLHPWYSLIESDLARRPPTFNQQQDCGGQCMNAKTLRLDRACYSQSVREFVENGISSLSELGLHKVVDYIKLRLLPVRFNDGIINDLIVLRMSLGALGYSRSHKIADVVDDIIANYKHNEDHLNDPEYIKLRPKLITRLRMVGYSQTERLILQGKYPDSQQFHASISSYLTSKSSGAAPITVSYSLRDKHTGKVKQMKQSLTSKAARAMFSGENVFDMTSIRPKFNGVMEYYESLSNEDQRRIMSEGLNDTDVRAIGISSIGSRATTATRAIRGIFVIPVQLHMALCAVAKPHVDDTSRPPDSGNTQSPWINPDNYGSSILTQFQDGSIDAYAPFIQASADRSYLISAADASAWDQHCKFELLAAWIEGIRDACKDKAITHNEYYMYSHGKGLTLSEICDEIIEFLRFGLFSISYGESVRVVKTNFMLSGLLVTFLLNSILNSEINYAMQEEFNSLSISTLSMLIAGDDIGAILKVDSVTSSRIEEIRDIICAKYVASGHEINKNKSVISNRSIEMAKIYAHLGFVFNDPYMQVNESEKTGKDESRISSLRGFAHKQFDAFRRSTSNTRLTTFVMRMCTMMAYHIKTFDKATKYDLDIVKYKYYPPYAASILPSAIKGGIGCTWTGVSLNEVMWIHERMSSCVSEAINVVDSLQFDSQEVFANAFLKQVIPRDKHHLIPKTQRQGDIEVVSVDVKSSNAKDAPLSINAGINYKMRHLKSDKIDLSTQAANRLQQNGINVDDGLKYENAPIMDMIQFSSTLKRSVTANRDDNVLNITKIFDLKTMSLKIDTTPKDLYQYYKLYKMVDYHVNFHSSNVTKVMSQAVRRPITPDTYRDAEKRHGPRYGDAIKLNLMGLNKALQRFVSKTGAHVTAETIQSALIKYDLFADANYEEKMISFLTVISGDVNSSTQAVHEMKSVDHTWSDMMIASAVNGTCAEYLNLKIDNMNRVMNVMATMVPASLSRLLKYSTFSYILCCEAYYDRPVRLVTMVQNSHTLKMVSDTKKASTKKIFRGRGGTSLSEELYETFERLKIQYETERRMLIDENRS
nr:MAG: putative RNA dependent RNA polymerase [Ilomantsi reovirus 4]